jgi:hypothetical protein
MDERIVFNGLSEADLSPEAREKLTMLLASQPKDSILQVDLFPNFDATSEDNLPSGMAITFASEAKVDPTLISDSLYQTFAINRIIPTEEQHLDDAFFTKCTVDVMDAVRQFPDQSISGQVHNRATNEEVRAWSPELGGEGSFAGVYGKLRDDHRTKDYFVLARGTAPLYVQDVKRRIAQKQPTFHQLVNEHEWCDFMGAAAESARRNVFRTMQNVAEACGVQIMRADDVKNGAPYEDMNLAYPELAVPDWEQPTHDIVRTQMHNKPCVTITYGIVPTEHALRMEDNKFFVVANPYDGVAVFNISNVHEVAALKGLPADTGRALQPEQVSRTITEYATRKEGVVWEQSQESQLVGADYHVDLHPSAFRPVDRSFKKAMKGMGWNPEDPVERMVCVVAKIFNPDIRRK